MYSNTENFKLQNRKHNNNSDNFAVGGKTLLKGRIGAVTVGHILRQLSRHTWYAIREGGKFQATVFRCES